MNSLKNFARSKHSPLNKGRQEGIFYKTLISNHSPFEIRRKLGEIVKNPPTSFIKGEMRSFPSPLTGEGTKGGGFKKKFHSIPSPLGRGLGGGFTLVELIVVVTILAILGTIAFISLQGYTQEARDSKRISDVRSLISKITIENAKGISYSEIMNEGGTGTSLKINGTSQTGTQNKEDPINREVLKENAENFRDPLTKRPYPFAYAVGEANGQNYNFTQLAYVSEKTGGTKLVGNYYKMNEGDDSPSLFIGCITDENVEIEENGCPIYDIGTPYTPPANCEPQQVITINGTYDITESRSHRGKITAKAGTLSSDNYIEYTQTFVCNNGKFEERGEEKKYGEYNPPTTQELLYNSNDAFVFAVNHKNEKVYIYYTNKVVIYDLHSKTTETVNLDITISSANYGIYYSYISELGILWLYTNGQLYYSTDLVNFVAKSGFLTNLSGANTQVQITYINSIGKFLFSVGGYNRLYYLDSLTSDFYTSSQLPFSFTVHGNLTYSKEQNRLITLLINTSQGYYSDNLGETWTQITLPANNYRHALGYSPQFGWLANATDNRGAYSSDGITWVAKTMPTSGGYGKMIYIEKLNKTYVNAYIAQQLVECINNSGNISFNVVDNSVSGTWNYNSESILLFISSDKKSIYVNPYTFFNE